MSGRAGWKDDEWAARVIRVLGDARYVNIGVGRPSLVPKYIEDDGQVLFHCENGILGTGPPPPADQVVEGLIDASTRPVTLQRGAAIVPLEASFGIIRGGHLDATVLGAFQVTDKGDLANWSGPDEVIAGVGGAMDLAAGARRVCVMMHHRRRDGSPKIVSELTYPATALRCVDVIVTELAVIEVTAQGLQVRELADGISFDELQTRTDAPLLRDVPPATDGESRAHPADVTAGHYQF